MFLTVDFSVQFVLYLYQKPADLFRGGMTKYANILQLSPSLELGVVRTQRLLLSVGPSPPPYTDLMHTYKTDNVLSSFPIPDARDPTYMSITATKVWTKLQKETISAQYRVSMK